MIISMYQASVPRFVNNPDNLSNILDKARVHVDAKKARHCYAAYLSPVP